MNKDSENKTVAAFLEPYHDTVRTHAVKRTAQAFNRSSDWVYKVLRGAWTSRNTTGVKEYYEQVYKTIAEKLNS